MKDKIIKYLDGDLLARDILIDELVEDYDFDITKQEAEILLVKKYGSPSFF